MHLAHAHAPLPYVRVRFPFYLWCCLHTSTWKRFAPLHTVFLLAQHPKCHLLTNDAIRRRSGPSTRTDGVRSTIGFLTNPQSMEHKFSRYACLTSPRLSLVCDFLCAHPTLPPTLFLFQSHANNLLLKFEYNLCRNFILFFPLNLHYLPLFFFFLSCSLSLVVVVIVVVLLLPSHFLLKIGIRFHFTSD